MCTLWLRHISLRLSSKAVLDGLADSLCMAVVGVVAIVDATVPHRTEEPGPVMIYIDDGVGEISRRIATFCHDLN